MTESAVLDDLIDGLVDGLVDGLDDRVRAVQGRAEWCPWPYEEPKVLVVEDDDDAREMLVGLLERAGVSVLQAATAGEALRLARSEQVSAVILDVMLPDGTGFEVCRLLRDDEETRRIRVIMVTALSSITDEVTGILAGADAYLVKPLRRKDLMRRLSDLL
ncbi:MAG TPA: response regulator [Kineosporiaceae bacterium]|nr:response regulator [Kineosporiaceae bacterium]